MMSFSERYTLKTLLGQGGMGEVWYAWDHMRNQHVAVKMMHPQTSADPNMRKSFHCEAEACSLLRHPHIVEIYDYGITEEKRYYLSMECIEGCTLHELSKCHLPLSGILDLICQILQALSHAHARGVIHRDLKAENVLVFMENDRLQVKLVDFGLAALPQGISEETQSMGVGTPGYMAPELILHRKALIGPATDIYAVGVLLFELLCGHLPFAGSTSFETMRAQLQAPVPPLEWQPHLKSLSDDVKAKLRSCIDTAMAKKTWQRFISIDAFETALQALMPPWEAYESSPLIDRLRQSQHEKLYVKEHEAFTDISQKIRALKDAEPSEDLPILRLENPDDSHLPVPIYHTKPRKRRPSAQLLNTIQRLSEIETILGADAIFYREILTSVSVLGTEASMPEIACFWHLDDDASLADCWREALASWCRHGILQLMPTEPYRGQATMKIQFQDPELISHLQSHVAPTQLRRLKAQAAMALLECYTTPTSDQMWRMARLWGEAGDMASFAQMAAQSAELAYHAADYQTAAKRFSRLGQLFDAQICPSSSHETLKHAIQWPEILMLAAQNAILLDDTHVFEAYCRRLKAWVEDTREWIWIAHVKRLHAIRYFRQENYQRAIELLVSSYDGFMTCNEQVHAFRTCLLKADAEISLSDPMSALQTLRNAQRAFAQMSCDLELACVNSRLAKLEWYVGNHHVSQRLGRNALNIFDHHQAIEEKAKLQAWMDFSFFISCPQNMALYRLIDSVAEVENHCDDVSLDHARSYLLIAYALNDNWEEIDDVLLRHGAKKHKAHYTSVLTGTISCVQAMRCVLQGDKLSAEDELSLAIASFGPQNRRARAWCHTFLGILAILDQDLDKGDQAFGRAYKDFGLLGDKLGEISVSITKSALQTACGHYHEAFSTVMNGIRIALDTDLHMHASLGFVIAAMCSIHEPKESALQLLDIDFQISIPAILRTHWLSQMDNVIEHYAGLTEYKLLTDKLLQLHHDVSRMSAEEPLIGFPSLELEL